nr:PD-(D/E)XK nuclease family protein [Ruminococcus bicirculans (ex Wegman et al. 2014)]
MLPYRESISYDVTHLPDLRKATVPITLNFSLLEDYFECPYRFKLSMFYGFVQPIPEQMGYGSALHEVIRNINLRAIEGKPITDKFVQKLFDEVFYLPYASQKQKDRMTESAKRAIQKYIDRNQPMLADIRSAESNIEIDMGDGITVNGRIDMVKDVVIDGEKKTVIVDFKTANKRVLETINTEQLKIYSLGYQKLTGQTADYMEIYHLDSENTAREPVTTDLTTAVETEIRQTADNIRKNNLPRHCSAESCSKCHLSHLCLSKMEQKKYTGG